MNQDSPGVSLVIPGRNCARTIGACLGAVVPILRRENSPLREIIFVDDASTDHTIDLVSRFPVRLLKSDGGGAGQARNVGWRAAQHGLIWFIDADCVSEPDALEILLPYLEDENVAGVGGSENKGTLPTGSR